MRNLPTTGNKNELTERLQAALLDGDTTLDDAALNADADLLDDDVLNVREFTERLCGTHATNRDTNRCLFFISTG